MIIIGIGANLPSPRYGSPMATCEAAVAAIIDRGIAAPRRSRWHRSSPVPASDQPWYINGVAEIKTALPPADILAILHDIETQCGRTPGERNAARILDLDILAFGDHVADGEEGGICLPHPRMHERAFVLLPLAELCPGWVHPVSKLSVEELILALPPGQTAVPVE
ncbi:MAG: 2-amino-4-hydroxy-6-hydroxymethyldihydropteridine diphosphokinase [Rhodospirillales bacterium RIFCSPLOWO2_12_FULL_58_28]|nr:MAG: 2-amino-4-hydroxy-6-hydroxymethyldihydropteridine diphosphokinase [Rhodospirillales bacterium RIFCSPLOWO2_02_FULL_58_16]OHC78986.1 MAG: 2-amino-4-hydroxy-6-hydroxymethyldihydropteridine diphosphokinase [Rhodospirillales bacterium RIFCSPLOWO2_12_FULL_58_28]